MQLVAFTLMWLVKACMTKDQHSVLVAFFRDRAGRLYYLDIQDTSVHASIQLFSVGANRTTNAVEGVWDPLMTLTFRLV